MVKCNRIDGKPCKCELKDLHIVYLLQTIVINTLKLICGELSNEERDELRTVTRIPHARRYLEIYMEELENNRELVADLGKCELKDSHIVYLLQTIVINTLKLICGESSNEERDELRTVTRIPHARRYLEIYMEELENNRELVADLVLRDEMYNMYC